MPLANSITFNELTGEELKVVLRNRLKDVLDECPHLQRHLTFPRLRMTLNVKLEIWADQPVPQAIPLSDRFDVVIDRPAVEVIEGEAVDCSAPIPGGYPPDEIRAVHGLPTSRPGAGMKEIGGHHFTVDIEQLEEEGEVRGRPGIKISRGTGMLDGETVLPNATVVKMDQGPAGLRNGEMRRENFGLKRGTP